MKGDIPPVYKIDLSLPPSERYVELATIYRGQMRSLVGLFDELVTSIHPGIPLRMVHLLARLCLRRLCTAEETEEIRGISRITGIKMHLLVSFNVLLDLLMGCTSGAARVDQDGYRKMVHFRTLDWGMDPLRDLVVQLEYIRSPEKDNVLATSITYVGFVGVLTGVRRNLSVSLNFRPVHDTRKNFAFYFNHLLVLLGHRRSISSMLRQCIMPTVIQNPSRSRFRPWRNAYKGTFDMPPPTLTSIVDRVMPAPTTAAYLTFSDGTWTVTMEKDYRSAIVRSSPSFIVVTNHDQEADAEPTEAVAEDKRQQHAGLTLIASETQHIADVIEDSNERRGCMQARWDQKVRQTAKANERARKQLNSTGNESGLVKRVTRSSTRLKQGKGSEGALRDENGLSDPGHGADGSIDGQVDVCASQKEVVKWLTTYPVVNESTHYACIMDPSEGKVAWVKRYA